MRALKKGCEEKIPLKGHFLGQKSRSIWKSRITRPKTRSSKKKTHRLGVVQTRILFRQTGADSDNLTKKVKDS